MIPTEWLCEHELCMCGHKRGVHAVAPTTGATGHSPCLHGACRCSKFTWHGTDLPYQNAPGYEPIREGIVEDD